MMHLEAAYGLLKGMEDKSGQMNVLASMAKAAGILHKHDSTTCECQALQLNKKCLELSKEIGNKVSMSGLVLNADIFVDIDAKMSLASTRALQGARR